MINNIKQAVSILKAGGLVAFPTETVYGLGGDASNESALKKIFLAKKRPMDHPLIVHIADIMQLPLWARDISPHALLLANVFWPGPLTLILKKAPHVSDLITGSQDTIGIRIPKHPIAEELLRAFGGGLAAPSANQFGRISPTTADAVHEELGDAVNLILDGGPCEIGLESTIVDVSGAKPIVLRPGMMTQEEIEAALQEPLSIKKKNIPRVSGSHISHYAPLTKTCLLSTKELSEFLKHNQQDRSFVIVGFKKWNEESVVMPINPKQYAHDIYSVLRTLDKKNFQKIMIEDVPHENEWHAISDRLQRAAG